MLGFGTSETRLHYDDFEYVSLIGMDAKSWGLSHKGFIWNNGRYKSYCEPFFDKDLRLGALINTYDQTIRFFLNRNDLGLAFK